MQDLNRQIKLKILMWFTRILFFVSCLALFFIPYGVRNFIDTPQGEMQYVAIVIMLYLLEIPNLIILGTFNKLLSNLKKHIIFDERNATILRILYICFFVAAILFLILTFWKLTSALLFLAAAFGGFSIAVLKSLFNKAIEIKKENDYTV